MTRWVSSPNLLRQSPRSPGSKLQNDVQYNQGNIVQTKWFLWVGKEWQWRRRGLYLDICRSDYRLRLNSWSTIFLFNTWISPKNFAYMMLQTSSLHSDSERCTANKKLVLGKMLRYHSQPEDSFLYSPHQICLPRRCCKKWVHRVSPVAGKSCRLKAV